MTSEAFDDLPITQRLINAKYAPMPKTSAVTSIFDAGLKAKPPRAKRGAACPPPTNVQILKGVPVPQNPQAARRKDVYGELLKSMSDGDMVILESLQARSMRSRAKKLGIEVTVRVLDNGKCGVWRLG
jgi:hypothetical protein